MSRLNLLSCGALIVIAAWAASNANGEVVEWDGILDPEDRWLNAENWNPEVVPTSTSDVTLGVFVETIRIDAEGIYGPPCPLGCAFYDPALKANSLTISTTFPFTVDGRISGGFGQTDITSLTLTTGDLTRQDVAFEEGNQQLDLDIRLAADGLWDIGGSGVLYVGSITESGGARTFTKTGSGVLSTGDGDSTFRGALYTTGAKTISQGTFEGNFHGSGVATIAPGAVFHVATLFANEGPGPTSPVILHGLPGSIFFGSMRKVRTGPAVLEGQLTIVDNPNISVDTGGSLTLAGGITNNNAANSGFGFFGSGELILSGPGTGSIRANVLGGQLTIAHDAPLGTGSVNVQDISGATNIPVLAFANGVAFANPITLRRATIRALGNSTVSSNITVSGFVATNNTLDVPDNNHRLTLTGPIADDGGGHRLIKTGPGLVILNGNTTISGGLTVAEGVLANHGTIIGPTTVSGRLIGSGQFGDVNVTDTGHFSLGPIASAGVFNPAIVAIEDLVFDGSTTELLIQLGGAAPGSGHDQLRVSGNARLDGQLVVGLAINFSLGPNQSYLVLDIAGTRSGQFAGFGEGALIGNFGGTDLFITYAADGLSGGGNDVALFTPALGLTGDYNQNGTVDASDYTVWRDTLGSTTNLAANGNGNTAIDAGDYDVWKQNFGRTSGGRSAAVPEPAATAPLMIGLLVAFGSSLKRRRAMIVRQP